MVEQEIMKNEDEIEINLGNYLLYLKHNISLLLLVF